METRTRIIPVQLSDGTVVKIEATPIGGGQDEQISSTNTPPIPSFKEATKAIKSIAKDIAEAMRNVPQDIQPDKMSVKLGLELAIESGQLTALIVKGAGKANLEIIMEWGKDSIGAQKQGNTGTP